MKKYFNYLKYVFEHKKNVFKVCWRAGAYWHAFTHDLSKFLPSELIPYANHDFSSKEHDPKFEEAFEKHYRRNKHHWQHWIDKDMPEKYINQMIWDWEAMSLKFGGSAKQYYEANRHKIHMSNKSRFILENKLGALREKDCCLSAVALHIQKINNEN